ncbi:MAG: carbohydrate ABC transporter permease [Trueperaceae bacterium]|jgi:trehalose/maltose transport system permease protein|nr:carbohydrate ABC transporter permease [Truepera sp.]HRN18013.1 carbohydrate ABC transporter permease [Trueperaceae bacterium]HRQ10378.1 carbohydrate ABC transporter permease [Trueperaceae bacterium]
MTASAERARRHRTRALQRAVGRFFFWLLIIVLFVYLMFPFYWALVSALKSQAELIQPPATLWPAKPVLTNFRSVLSNDTFVRALGVSTIVASSVTILSLLVGSFAGYALGKMRFRGRGASLYVILAMTMFPQIAVLAGLYAVIRLLNMPAVPSMILSYMLFTLPFTVWVLTSFFKGLPDSLLQAAQVDGATLFQAFRYVLLPLTAPALVTTGLLAFIQAWNEYLFALTFTVIDPPARTVPVAIALFTGEVARQEPFGEIMAAAVIVTIPLVVLVLIFQQRIVAGLTAGAVKG